MQYIADEGANGKDSLISLTFASYVFLKGIWQFQANTLSKKLTQEVLDWEKTMERLNKKTKRHWKGHPMQLIYKYLALIALKQYDHDTANRYVKLISRFPADDGILRIIKNHCILCVRNEQGVTDGMGELRKETVNLLYNINPEVMAKAIGRGTSFADISKVVTYMYQ